MITERVPLQSAASAGSASSFSFSSSSSETELVRLCQQKSWSNARIRASTNPTEAKPTHSARRGIGNTALALAVRGGAPLDIVRTICEADVDQLIAVKHCRRGTVLHEAVRYRAGLDVVNYLVDVVSRHEELLMLGGEVEVGRGGSADTSRATAASSGITSMNEDRSTSRPATRTEPTCSEASSSAYASSFLSALSDDFESRSSLFDSPPTKAKKRTSSRNKAAAEGGNKDKTSIPLLGQTDDVGRTVLHHLADRIVREVVQSSSRSTTDSFANFRGPPAFRGGGGIGGARGMRDNSNGETSTQLTHEDFDNMLDLCRKVARAYPPAILMNDIDGYTPLVIALVVPPPGKFSSDTRYDGESTCRIDCVVEEMTSVFLEYAPEAADLSSTSTTIMGLRSAAATAAMARRGLRRVDRSHHCTSPVNIGGGTFGDDCSDEEEKAPKEICGMPAVNIGPNPLYFALVHRRSIPTIEMILSANSTPPGRSSPSCTAIVTSDLEVPLHVAVTMRAPTEVIRLLLLYGPEAAAAGDSYSLTPLDWLWMRHVLDRPFLEIHGDGGHEANDAAPVLPPFMPSKPSSRRYIPKAYLQIWNDAAEEIESLTEAMSNNNRRRSFHQAFQNYRVGAGALWERASMMLPCAAAAIYEATQSEQDVFNRKQKWPVVHAAAYVPCPRPLLDLAIYYYPDQVREKDEFGRLPLHYAVSRSDRDITYHLPAGVAQTVTPYVRAQHRRSSMQSSPVVQLVQHYPEGCRIADPESRLPLHIALDTVKEYEDEEEQQILGAMPSTPRRPMFLHNNRHNGPAPTTNRINNAGGFARLRTSSSSSSFAKEMERGNEAGRLVIRCLLEACTDTFERRDPTTLLYPFMQAAVGERADADIVYMLLREHPSLCKHF